MLKIKQFLTCADRPFCIHKLQFFRRCLFLGDSREDRWNPQQSTTHNKLMKTLIAHVPLKTLSLVLTICCALLLPTAQADDPPLQMFECPTCASWPQPLQTCGSCNGSGYWEREVWGECWECNGTGVSNCYSISITCTWCYGYWQDAYGNILCFFCEQGIVNTTDGPCPTCNTSGIVKQGSAWDECPECKTFGTVPCKTCDGIGYVWK